MAGSFHLPEQLEKRTNSDDEADLSSVKSDQCSWKQYYAKEFMIIGVYMYRSLLLNTCLRHEAQLKASLFVNLNLGPELSAKEKH